MFSFRGAFGSQANSLKSRWLQGAPARSMAIYAVGEGWTGALTRKYVMETIEGHFDEDSIESPVLIYPGDDVQQVSAGWGSSAILDTQGQVHLVGRPQDLMNLLRMNRMPERVRRWANQNNDSSETTMIGSMISRLIGFATGGDEEKDWDEARKFSLLHDWTRVDLSDTGDSRIAQVVSSAGFLAMIGASGTLYTMGVNSRGQCGTGEVSNNIWSPEPVLGISRGRGKREQESDQDEAVVQVALGFQQGYALTKSGLVYSWGKANRGQLAREVDSDQESQAGKILFDGTATQIAAGMHHGALLATDGMAYIWGKNMGRPDETDSKPIDARIPQPVLGLPADSKILKIACGSHHTALLLEDGSVYAVGVASDEAVPLFEPVQLVEPGTLELPVQQFDAHHDRTTVIDRQGQVLQAHLWKDESLREHAAFTPTFVDTLWDDGQSVETIHRGWMHTLIETSPCSSS